MQNTSEKHPTRHSKAVGRPRLADSWNADALRSRADQYFAKCNRRSKTVAAKDGPINIPDPAPYTLEGLCCFLSISVNTFKSWLKLDSDLGEAAILIHQQIIADRIEGALDGRQHASFAQFLLKNNDPEHYRDKVEVENTVAEDAKNMFEAWSKMWKNQP